MVKNLRYEPFKCMVTIGDSITVGMSASSKEFCWANRLASELSQYQDKDILHINKGVSSNLISLKSPAYDHSSKPCGIERFEKDVIKLNPDLVIIAYGLNDIRGGTPVDIFIKDLDFMIKEIKKNIDAIIVLVNVYFMLSFDFSPGIWDKGSVENIKLYNKKMEELSYKNDVLYADIYSSMNEANWTISQDGIHPNNLGHKLIANKIFEVIATNFNFFHNL